MPGKRVLDVESQVKSRTVENRATEIVAKASIIGGMTGGNPALSANAQMWRSGYSAREKRPDPTFGTQPHCGREPVDRMGQGKSKNRILVKAPRILEWNRMIKVIQRGSNQCPRNMDMQYPLGYIGFSAPKNKMSTCIFGIQATNQRTV